MYINQNLAFDTEKFRIFNRSNKDIEVQWIYIPNKFSKDSLILNLYRPPAGNVESFIETLENTLSVIEIEKFDVFVMGDFNVNIANANCGHARSLKTNMRLLGLKQLINNSTRIERNTESCIDLIFTNCDFVCSSGTYSLNLSDHELVFCTKKRTPILRPKVDFMGRSYRNFDPTTFANLMRNCDWETFDTISNVEEMWNIFISNVRQSIDYLCPLKHFKIRTVIEPWLNNEILEEIRDKDLALRRAKRTNRPDHWAEARMLRNRCLSNIRKAKSTFICEKLEENRSDTKKFWNTINTILPGKNKIKHEISLTREDLEVPKGETPEYMNGYFSTIGANLAKKFPEHVDADNGEGEDIETLPQIVTTELEVLNLVRELNVCKSSAIDQISTKVMKEAFFSQITRLVRLFNLSLRDGSIPDSWKCALIVPLHKGGNVKDVNNYRPVSLLPIQGKVIEKIVHNRLISHLEEHDILDSRQGGFRKNHSTTDTSVNFVDDIYRAMNTGEITIAVFIDLRKAFDTVNHNILNSKLHKYGIRNANLTWIKNYLTNREQQTLVNGSKSGSLPVTCGVPQGSVLGPLLFLVYVNNMSNVLSHANYCLYADDTVLYVSGQDTGDMVEILQQDLERYSNWCVENHLTLNVSKTKFVVFGTKQRTKRVDNIELFLNDSRLFKEPYYKYLGILLDSSLSYKQHMEQCAKIVSHKIYLLSKIRKWITEDTAVFIYKSMIAPILDYGDIIYMGGLSANLSKLQRLQNRALRICLNIHHYLPTILLHQQTKVPNLVTRRSSNLKKYMFKQKENEELVQIPVVNTRLHDAITFKTVRPKIEKYKKNPLYRGALLWNSLSSNVRNIEDYPEFKRYIRNWAENVTMLNN